MKKIIQFITISVLFSSSLAWSETEESASVKLIQALEQINSYSSEFLQEITDANGNEVQTTEGIFKAKRPGLFYWKTLPPYEQIVIGNEDRLWVYDPDLEQVTIHNQIAAHNTPAAILSGDLTHLAKNFDVKMSKKGKLIEYSLFPKEIGGQSFSSLMLQFKGKNLKSLTLKDQLEQNTHIIFSKTKNNPAIDDSTFTFIPPEGTDIVQQ